MKTKRTFGIVYYLKKDKAKEGLIPIYARITVNGERIVISVKRSIEESNWNSVKGNAKGSKEEVKQLNLFLEQYRSNIVSVYQDLVVQKKIVTAEIIKNIVVGNDDGDSQTLMGLVEYHNTNFIGVLSQGTLKNYSTTKKYLELFLRRKYNRKDMALPELNYSFIEKFEMFLRSYQPEDHQKPMQNNGVMKHLERFRKMITLAVKHEWIAKDPFQLFNLKFDRVEKRYLTAEELKILERKKFTVPRIDHVRDLFIFSCYTAFAYIDVMKLKPSNIETGIDGKLWIRTERTKTNIPVHLPLLPKALQIIEKYKDDPRVLSQGTLLPVMSNQKLNAYLKEVADMCNISKCLTFHLARHTFATTVTLTNGVPIESVSKMMGHTKISTTQIYVTIVEKKISHDMALLEQVLKK